MKDTKDLKNQIETLRKELETLVGENEIKITKEILKLSKKLDALIDFWILTHLEKTKALSSHIQKQYPF